MSKAEHYLENLLQYGKDADGDPNKSALPEAERKTIEMCYQYIVGTLFYSRENLQKAIAGLHAWDEIEKCIKFHKLDEIRPDDLTGFEGFVIEQWKTLKEV